MITQIEVAELGPRFETLVDELHRNGGEISLTRDGEVVAKLVRVESAAVSDNPPVDGKVFYNGRWMIPAAAERERAIEHLRGSGKILGDIVSPIDDVEWDALKWFVVEPRIGLRYRRKGEALSVRDELNVGQTGSTITP